MAKMYAEFARTLAAYLGCSKHNNHEWAAHWEEKLSDLHRYLPHGSGIDAGVKLNVDKSTPGKKLVFDSSYHRMNEVGMYDGWVPFRVIVKPCLMYGARVRVAGRMDADLRDYLEELFTEALHAEYKEG